MKKNRMMRLASLLLVLVLMTSSVVGGTFAKYTTSAEATATARVAYWGFEEPTTVAFDLFKHGDANVANTENLLAPGTENEINFEFINAKADDRKAEVAYQVTVDVTDESIAPSTELDDQITWTYNGDDYATWAEFVAAIEDETVLVNVGDDLPKFLKNGETNKIGWRWEYSDGSDVADTALGNNASAAGVVDVKLAIKVTVEQVD